MESLEQNKAVVRRLFAAIDAMAQGRDAASEFDAACAPGFQMITPGVPPLDQQGFMGFIQGFAAAFPGYVHDIQDQVVEGDRVATRLIWRGTQTGEFQGIPATGRSVEIGSLNIDRFENGKIVERRAIFDTLGMLQQLGAIPTPEGAGA